MDPATIHLILQLAFLVSSLIAKAMLAKEDIKMVFDKYQGMEITPELITAIRNELLDKAKLTDPLDDQEIRDLLLDGGTDPESLRT